jgi:hypothetical protein
MSMYIFEEAGGPFQVLQSPRRSFGKELRCHPDMQSQFHFHLLPNSVVLNYKVYSADRHVVVVDASEELLNSLHDACWAIKFLPNFFNRPTLNSSSGPITGSNDVIVTYCALMNFPLIIPLFPPKIFLFVHF